MSYTTPKQDFALGSICIILLSAYVLIWAIIFGSLAEVAVQYFILLMLILITALLFTLFMSTKASLVVQMFVLALVLFLDFGPWYAKLVVAMVIAAAAVGLDVVKRKIDELLRQRDSKQAELETAMEELRKVDQMKDEVIFIASHDLRTPLSIIKSNLSTIREGYAGKVNKEARSYIDAAYRASERLGTLLEELLEASVHEHTHDVNLEPVQFEEVIDDIVTSHDAGSLTIKRPKKPYKTPKVLADRVLLQRALENLYTNCVKYTTKGSIIFHVEDTEKYVRCSVTDTGIGITPEALDRMFTKFYRAPNAVNANTRGTGLGLYITKQLIQKLKGNISVKSKVNVGSTFIVELPKVNA